jgi:hypothetical protein
VKFAQLRPAKNNAVSIDDEITRPRLHRDNLNGFRSNERWPFERLSFSH